MNLTEITNGATIFIDANILIYAVERRSPQCRLLLERCDSEAVYDFMIISSNSLRRNSVVSLEDVGTRRTTSLESHGSDQLGGMPL